MNKDSLWQNPYRIAYSKDQTVLLHIQTDAEFIRDVRKIADKKRALDYQLFRQEQDLPPQDIQEIVQRAQAHQQANIFNKTSMMPYDTIEQEISCNCGCRRGKGEYFPICLNEQSLNFLGPGVILFFFYLRNLRNLVLCLFIVYGSFCCASNALGSDYKTNCSQLGLQGQKLEKVLCVFVEFFSYSNKPNSQLLRSFQVWLGIMLCLVWLFGLKFIQMVGQEKDKKIDALLESASDFSIKIDNLPYGDFSENQLIEYLKHIWHEYGPQGTLNLKSIQIVYNTQKVRDLMGEIQGLSLKMLHCFKGTTYNFSNHLKQGKVAQYKDLKRNYINKVTELEQIRKNFLSDENYRKSLSTTCAIIQFQSQEQQRQFLGLLGSKKNPLQSTFMTNKRLIFKDTECFITRAPEPSDIIWLNCEKKFSIMRYLGILGSTAIILYIGYFLIALIQTTEFFKSLNVFVIPITLQLFNRVIWILLGYLVPYEYNNTKSQTIISLMKKSMTAQAINIIVTSIAAVFLNNKSIYGHDGLQGVVFYFQWSMLLLMQLYYTFEPFYVGKKLFLSIPFIRNYIINRIVKCRPDFAHSEDIRQVLTMYEGPQFPVAGGYVYMATSIFHCLFYCHLQPAILIFVAINISVFFYITKFMLLRRCKIPELTEVQIFQLAIFSFSTGAAFYGGGSLFFTMIGVEEVQNDTINPYQIAPSIICLIIWFICALNPCNFMEKGLKKVIKFFEYGHEFTKVEDYEQTLDSDFRMNKKKENISVEPIANSILFETVYLQNKTWSRRQCYYRDSGLNKLLEFQKILKDNEFIFLTKSQVKKGKANMRLKEFCESFFKQKKYDFLQEIAQQKECISSNIKEGDMISPLKERQPSTNQKHYKLVPVRLTRDRKVSNLVKKTQSIELTLSQTSQNSRRPTNRRKVSRFHKK